MIKLKTLNLSDIFVMLCVWFAAIVSLLSDSINQIALYAILPLAFITTFVSFGKLQVNKYFNLLVSLFIWIIFSVIWATDTAVALAQVKQIFGSFILCYIVSVKARNPHNIFWLYITYILLLIFAWYYAYNNIFTMIEVGEERVNDEKLNANTLAYYTFYATFATYILGDVINKVTWSRIFRFLFLLIIPLSFITAILTASRQVLIIQVPLIIILLYIRYIKGRKMKQKLVFYIFLMICLIIAIPSISEEYDNSYLKQRSELDVKEDSRSMLAKDAFKVGLAHFPLGVGPGNYVVHSLYKKFSHNTYLELFVNEGVIGLYIYIYMMMIFLKRQWRRYKFTKDKIYFSFFIFGLFFVIDGIFYSFYTHLWLITFFIIVASHSETYHKNNILKYEYQRKRNLI